MVLSEPVQKHGSEVADELQEEDYGEARREAGAKIGYWIPPFQILEERGFKVYLVNAQPDPCDSPMTLFGVQLCD